MPDSMAVASVRMASKLRSPGRPDLLFDLRPLLAADIADLEQRIDEEAQAEFGRQAPGAWYGARRSARYPRAPA